MIRRHLYQRILFGKINLLLLIIWICLPTFHYAQVPSLEDRLDIADSLFVSRDYSKTANFLDSLIKSAQDEGSIDIESQAIFYHAKIKHDTYHHQEAIILYQDFRRCREEAQLQYDTFSYQQNLANCFASISKPQIALSHYDTAYTYLDQKNNIEIGNYFGGLAYFFGNNNHDSLALELIKHALGYFKTEKLTSKIIWYLYDLAYYSEKLDKYQESIQYLDTVIQLAYQEHDTMAIWMGLACRGINEIKLSRYESGINNMEMAAELEHIFDQKLCCANDVYIALGYGELGQLDKMEAPLNKALGQLEGVIDLHDRVEVYEALSDVYTILGDDKEALNYYKIYRQLDDSIANKKYSADIAKQEVKLGHNKLLDQIKNSEKLHRKQQSKLSLTKIMLSIALVGFLIFLGLYIINIRKLRSYKYDYQLWKLAFDNSYKSVESDNPHFQDANWLQSAKLHVVNNLNNESFKVTDLAKLLSLNQRELNSRLNRILQMTANKFINTIRIEHAKELLMDRSKSIAEISYEVGFSDSAYFSRVFKTATGVAPKNWSTT